MNNLDTIVREGVIYIQAIQPLFQQSIFLIKNNLSGGGIKFVLPITKGIFIEWNIRGMWMDLLGVKIMSYGLYI